MSTEHAQLTLPNETCRQRKFTAAKLVQVIGGKRWLVAVHRLPSTLNKLNTRNSLTLHITEQLNFSLSLSLLSRPSNLPPSQILLPHLLSCNCSAPPPQRDP